MKLTDLEHIVENIRTNFDPITKKELLNSGKRPSGLLNGTPVSHLGSYIHHDPKTKHKSADVAVIDQPTGHSGITIPNLPVVLAIGINYTQCLPASVYAPRSSPIYDVTRMRPKLNKVFSTLRFNKTAYHLVATNFFPWITIAPWTKLFKNYLEEMLFLEICGYTDPFQHIDDLIKGIGVGVHAVVFHGVNNAVVYLGREFVKRPACPKLPFIFCDNLVRGPVRNAILW